MPGELSISEFVLYAEIGLAVGPDSQVTGAAIGVRSFGTQAGGPQLVIAAGSVIDQARDVIAPSVDAAPSAVCGPILTDALTGGHVPPEPQPFPVSQMPALPLAMAGPAGSGNVTVGAGQQESLAPGSYGDLRVDGTLVLAAGDYGFASVHVGAGAHLVSSGSAHVWVSTRLTAGPDARIHPGAGHPAGHLVISVGGSDEDRHPAVRLAERSQVRALLNAPHATADLGDHAEFTGALAAFRIITGEHVTVRYESGFSPSDPQGSQQVTGAYGVPPGPGLDPVAAAMPQDTIIWLRVGLPIRAQRELADLIQQVSDPHSPQYRQYITQETFASDFGAPAADYQALRDWADNAGLTTVATFPTNLLLSVAGPAALVQQALHVNLFYRERADGIQYPTADRELSVNLSVPLLEINGLGAADVPTTLQGSGWSGDYIGPDLRMAYLGVDPVLQALDGVGQNVGIVGWRKYSPDDVQAYASLILSNQPVPPSAQYPPMNVSVVEAESDPPFTRDPAGGPGHAVGEADLDVQMVYAMAPGATISFFKGSGGIYAHLDAILHSMANYKPALTVASCSLGFYGNGSAHQALEQMAAQGVSFFTASGDTGNAGGPSSTSFQMGSQTLVGGTVLNTNPLVSHDVVAIYPVPYYAGENSWPYSGGGVMGSSGIPGYQVGIMNLTAAANGGSKLYRNYPDVAMPAINLYAVQEASVAGSDENLLYGATGTSFAAPLWAGFAALVNQLSMQNGNGLVGFLNPVLYDIGLTADQPGDADLYAACFNDIADGASNNPSGHGPFLAVPGYDLVTGLGSPKAALIYQLASATPLTPTLPLSIIRFTIKTGDDNLRDDSTATATVILQNGGQFIVTLKQKNQASWDNWTVHGPLDFAIPSTLTLPTMTEGLQSVQINLIQGGNWTETADNWDVVTLQVSLLSPNTEPVCQLNLTGDAVLQDGSHGLFRLSQTAGSSGDGPHSPAFTTGPGSGC
jgi:Pro-kumamolisin, activation domain/Subtilase family